MLCRTLLFAVIVVGLTACGDSAYEDKSVGDSCDGFLASCSVDGTTMLKCVDDKFVAADECSDGCLSGPNGTTLIAVGTESVCCHNGDNSECLSIH